ncbi:MAG: response regulator transcription factor [Anaerolineaceae bacterium]|nr:response regulator transcription factor [Anaerolineaceae bacterium]
MIKILICDDQEIVREGLRNILESDPDLSVVAAAVNGQDALDMLKIVQPDLILMDLHMPVKTGPQAIREIRAQKIPLPILVLTTYTEDTWLFEAIRSGASGYLLKDRPGDELIAAIKETFAGGNYIDPQVAGKLIQNISGHLPNADQEPLSLSQREQEILVLLVKGYSNTEIARRLYLSEGTVRNHMTQIFSKLEVTDRTQAAVRAIKLGLVSFNQI